jgi:large repetitive protein
LGEICDDGNTVSRDGCSSTCQVEYLPYCGNGALNPGEECDDANLRAGDGCNELCRHETGGCPNGRLETARGEQCDDGNNRGGDGCSAGCKLEATVECGDGVIQPGTEQCDTGPLLGFGPSACRPNCIAPYCGDNVLDFNEQCDDGNGFSGDGCSSLCEPERTAAGTGFPPVQGSIIDRVDEFGRPVTIDGVPVVDGTRIPTPAGTKTGPGLVIFLASGAAAGIGFARRRLKK